MECGGDSAGIHTLTSRHKCFQPSLQVAEVLELCDQQQSSVGRGVLTSVSTDAEAGSQPLPPGCQSLGLPGGSWDSTEPPTALVPEGLGVESPTVIGRTFHG